MENEKYDTLIRNLELLEEQGVNILSPNALDRLRRRYRQISAQLRQYKRPGRFSKRYVTTISFRFLMTFSRFCNTRNFVFPGVLTS